MKKIKILWCLLKIEPLVNNIKVAKSNTSIYRVKKYLIFLLIFIWKIIISTNFSLSKMFSCPIQKNWFKTLAKLINQHLIFHFCNVFLRKKKFQIFNCLKKYDIIRWTKAQCFLFTANDQSWMETSCQKS